jgi:hypothetical protein
MTQRKSLGDFDVVTGPPARCRPLPPAAAAAKPAAPAAFAPSPAAREPDTADKPTA